MLAWALVVALGSSVVWGVVSRAGEQAGGAESETTAWDVVARPTPRPTPRPTTSPTARPTATPTPAAAPAAVRGTWWDDAGTVVAACRGTAIALVRAVPSADGYAVEVEDRGPERLRVDFTGREDESGREARVEAVCEGGRPRFRASSGD